MSQSTIVSNTDTTLLNIVSTTITQTSVNQVGINGAAGVFVLNVTAIAGGTILLTIQGVDPTSGAVYPLLASAAVGATGTTVYMVGPALPTTANVSANTLLPRTYNVKVVPTGATATYTVSCSDVAY